MAGPPKLAISTGSPSLISADLPKGIGRVSLDHQIADCQHESVGIDEDTGALAFAAQTLHSASIRRDVRVDPHHRRNELFDGSWLGRRGGRAQQRYHAYDERHGGRDSGAAARTNTH